MKAGFDIAAKSYDETFTQTTIGSGQRRRVWAYLQAHIDDDTPLRILELNCGTGEDALFLARASHQVIATDISNDMIEVCRAKAERLEVDRAVTFQQMDMRALHVQSFDLPFDLIFSNFGGLNCLAPDEIEALFKTMESLLSDRGSMILVVMPRYCIFESIYFFMKLRFAAMFRRNTANGLFVNVEGVDLKTFYYSPSDLLKLLSKSWTKNKVQSIGFVPSYLEKQIHSNKFFGNIILTIDKLLYRFNCSNVSDHYLFDVTLQKPLRV